MQWYQRRAAADEPYALAHLAEREEFHSLNQSDATERNNALLRAFQLYARAVNVAQSQGWPSEAWQHWRYRRASLARLLANDGLMQRVATAYAVILGENKFFDQ